MALITIYTDGSCRTDTQTGGWAAILTHGERRRVLTGRAEATTVNAMELTAVIEALAALKSSRATAQVFTDSPYIDKGVNVWLRRWTANGWTTQGKQAIAHRPLWERLHALMTQHAVTVTSIPRAENAEADALAQAARQGNNPVPDPMPETDTPTAPTPIPMTHLLIAGSRDATRDMLDYARRAVKRAHQLGWTVLVGDNPKGVDMAVVQECRRLQTKVIVAGVFNFPRNYGCQHGEYVKVTRDLYRSAGGDLLDGYTVRDRWMVDNAQHCLFIWNDDSPGTKAGYDYAVQRGKHADLKTFGVVFPEGAHG